MSQKNLSSKLIQYIENHFNTKKGQVTFQELMRYLQQKNKPVNNKKQRRTKRAPKSIHEDLRMLVNSLVDINVLQKLDDSKVKTINKSKWQILSPGLAQGVFFGTQTGHGFVTVDGTDKELYLPPKETHNLMMRDRILVELIFFARGKWEGRVIQILKAQTSRVFALYHKPFSFPGINGAHLARVLDQPGVDWVIFSHKKNNVFVNGQPIVIKLNRGDNGFVETKAGNFPEGTLLEILNESDSDLDFKRVSIKNNLPLQWPKMKYLNQMQQWSSEYNTEWERIAFLDRESAWAGLKRENLSKVFTITMDGASAKDFDDALSLEIRRGKYHLFVHIADLAIWLSHGSDLDREAMTRGNSTYLQHKVIPMLPPFFSEDHCSLRQGEVKAALTCELVYDNNFHLLNFRFYPSLIEVDHRLTYEQGHALLDKKSLFQETLQPFDKDISDLRKFFSKIFTLTQGVASHYPQKPLDLHLPDLLVERNLGVHSEEPTSDDVFLSEESVLKSHKLIEIAMLEANRAAALFLKQNNMPALFRVHEKPDYEKIYALQQELAAFNISWEVSVENPRQSMLDMLQQIKGNTMENLFHYKVLRSMKQANYSPQANIGHFGLGFSDYLHFTSPIRRYPDLVVHRQIRNLLAGKKAFYSDSELNEMGLQMSQTERQSTDAERTMLKLAVCRYMESKVGQTFQVRLTGTGRDMFFVTWLDIPVEGRLLLENIRDDYYVYDPTSQTAIGRKYGRSVKMGADLWVALDQVDWEEATVDFAVDSLRAARKNKR